jgi:transposase
MVPCEVSAVKFGASSFIRNMRPSLGAHIIRHRVLLGNLSLAWCLSSIILSPRNGNVKMSPYETGDICIEPERITTSGGEAALAHASRGRPSHRRLPQRVRDRILQLARTTYAGFNDHHLCEKLVEQEGLSLGRETLRRLLRSAGIRSPRKRRAPTHRQRRPARAREGEMLLLDGSFTAGWKIAARS